MKRLIVCTLLCLFVNTMTEAQSRWSMGAGFRPFLYWYYNRTDEKFLKEDFKIHYPNSIVPNGWQVGIPIQYQYSDALFFQTALEYSTQTIAYEQCFFQSHLFSRITNSRMNYFKAPLFVGFRHHFILTDNFIYAMIGPQVLFLSSYNSVGIYNSAGSIKRIDRTQEQNSNFSVISTTLDGMTEISSFRAKFNQWPYRRFVIGCVAELGVNFRIAAHYRMFAGVRGDADLSGIDNVNATFGENKTQHWELGVRHSLRYTMGEKRSHTYQFRLGLHVGMLYELR